MRKISIVILLMLWPTAASACSFNEDFDPLLTNIELIEKADLVVLGRVEARSGAGAAYGSPLDLTPLRTLKGRAPEKLVLYGVVRDRTGTPIPPEPTSLDRVHSSSTWGSCSREGYAPGTLVVAMFTKRNEGFVQTTYSYARNVEDVAEPDGLWVRAAALYAQIISENAASQRRHAFQKARERLLTYSSDPQAQAIAQDIASYLAKAALAKAP